MSGSILISTHDLPTAGSLREAFSDAGYGVELVTPDEDLDADGDAVLLAITDAAAESRTGGLVGQARDLLSIPVFGVFPTGTEHPPRLAETMGLTEAFAAPVDADEVLLLAHRLLERRRLQSLTGIVGETDAMREALERVVQIAPVDSTVLVTGESGTGKELVARGIHALSPRRHKAFIAVNVAALSQTLLESELFGHEKGAFTGAIDSRRGLFELADHGTIFLDEIGEMPLTTQTKLLRVLEQREFRRVGGERSIRVDVRIITATNQNLRRLVAVGDFRRDLYYRLNVLHIELPPLRDRSADVPRLVSAFIGEVSSRHDRPFVGISHEAMRILEQYPWPGNVRELRNLVESMVVLAPGKEIGPDDIPLEVRSPGASFPMITTTAGAPEEGSATRTDFRPQLEFIFRTMVELRVDMDELRSQFEAYRRGERGIQEVGTSISLPPEAGRIEVLPPCGHGSEDGTVARSDAPPPEDDYGWADPPLVPALRPEDDPGVVVFRPGMTMDDLEREAIQAALGRVRGNRRKASEMLGIGERTLYRKIRKFGLE